MAQRKRTDSYWIKRANQRLTRSERISKAHMRELAKVYNEARRQTVESLKQIYAAYYKGQDGFDMQALRSIVPSGELKRFLDDMKKLGISTDLPDNYNARITRLRFINEQLAAQAHKVAMSERTIDSKALREVYTDSYYRAGYDVARGIGSTPSGFSTLDQRTVDKVMNARFEGRNFSTRVWKNSDILASKLKGELATAIATGQSIQKTAARFRDDFNVNQYYAERLIRTETNHFHNSAELEAYKEMGFEKFKFLATLDNRTSEICQEMDGKIFNVKDGLPGENIPPLHPNCRSTIVPYFKKYEPETRLYRDPEDGKNKYMYNIQFHDWARTIGKPELSYGNRPKGAVRPFKRDVKRAKHLYEISDRTDKLLERARPNIGSIRKMSNYDKIATIKLGDEEQEGARWLLKTLGGNIQHIPAHTGTTTPDYKWGRNYLELKTLSTKSLNSLSKRMEEGSAQIGKYGGLLLNLTEAKELWKNEDALWRRIHTDMYRYNIKFVIVRRGDDIAKYFVKTAKKR